jgi:hypothetical protein
MSVIKLKCNNLKSENCRTAITNNTFTKWER